MSFSRWFRSPRIRRAVALSSVVLATGGLVLCRASASAFPGAAAIATKGDALPAGKTSTTFAGPAAHGVVSLSHSHVLAGTTTTVFADVRVAADASPRAAVRAPISLAVVLDTSGSMSGEKIEDAKRSVLRLLTDMRDDDEIALVRYDDSSELVQPLARVGAVRSALTARIRGLQANGGTNIPSGLAQGLHALDEAARARVKRIVLVSDGLDDTRARAEELARTSFGSGITVSSLGIGLDFDQSYMGSVAEAGHGNFAFVNDGASLATFLQRELVETSTTTVESARVHLELPEGMHFVSASGADAIVHGSDVELVLGSLFAGDQRRVVVELGTYAGSPGMQQDLGVRATWSNVGGASASATASPLHVEATNDRARVDAGRDGAVLASAASVFASKRQVEAANAYAQGDVARAASIAAANERALAEARAIAPPAAAPSLDAQLETYRGQRDGFLKHAPSSAAGRAAAKAGAAKDMSNLNRSTF